MRQFERPRPSRPWRNSRIPGERTGAPSRGLHPFRPFSAPMHAVLPASSDLHGPPPAVTTTCSHGSAPSGISPCLLHAYRPFRQARSRGTPPPLWRQSVPLAARVLLHAVLPASSGRLHGMRPCPHLRHCSSPRGRLRTRPFMERETSDSKYLRACGSSAQATPPTASASTPRSSSPPVNALHPMVIPGLKEKYTEPMNRVDVKAIVLTGDAGKFSGGFDISVFAEIHKTGDQSRLPDVSVELVVNTIEDGKKPFCCCYSRTCTWWWFGVGNGLSCSNIYS